MTAQLPLLPPAIGWVMGIAALRADLIDLAAWPWAAAAMLALAVVRRGRVFALAALLGLGWGAAMLFWDSRQVAVEPTWLTADRTITATISEVRQIDGGRRLLLTHVQDSKGGMLRGRALLYVYADVPLLPGWRIQTKARWRLPRNFANPGTFDFRAYCFDRRIALIGYSRSRIEVLAQSQGLWQRARTLIEQALAVLPAAESGVLQALILGRRAAVPSDLAEAFAATGAAHLLAISGLHVGMVAGWGVLLCWWLLTRRQAWIVHLPLRRLCLAVGAVAAALYATLAGWPLPTQRAVLMLAAAVLAWWLRARTQPLNTLLFALMLILAWDPRAVTSASLWLSFTAAAALIAWTLQRPYKQAGTEGWVLGLFWVSLVAAVATLPLIAHLFERIPTYGLFVNLLLVPWYAVAVLPPALAGAVCQLCGIEPVAHALLALAATGVSWGNKLLYSVQSWPGANLWIATPPAWIGPAYAAAMIAAALLFRRRRHILAAVTVAAGLSVYLGVCVPERPPTQPLWAVWDVGQGAASVLVLSEGKVLAVDAPGRYGSRFNGGSSAAAALRHMGLAHADVLVLTHAQQDHIGGAWRFVDGVRFVRELWLADVPANREHPELLRLRRRIARAGGLVRWLQQGDEIDVGRSHLTVLWPPAGLRPANANNASLVLSLAVGDVRLLLPADIEAEAESAIAAGGLSRHDIALMPHHGSATSSSSTWVAAIKPAYAVAQAGLHNRYGFPRPSIVSRYKKAGSRVFTTAHGAVVFTLPAAGKGVRMRQYRQDRVGNRQRALQWWRAHL